MDDLKERVRQELERIQPSPDALEDTLRRVRHRERRQRLAAGIVALALSAGTLGFLVTVFLQTEPTRPAASPTGGLIAFDMGEDIYVMNPDGSEVRNLTGTDNVFESAPAWSPDGSHIAFVACTECTTSDIYVMNADGTRVTRLTDDAALDDAPAWSPDGTQIIYHSDQQAGAERQEDRDLYVVNADGTGKRRLTEGPALDGDPTWSPDGTRIAFNRLVAPTESSAIHIMSIDGSGEERLTDPSLWAVSPDWSPDGSRIAFSVVDLATTTPDVYVMNADGTGLRKLTDDPPAAVQAWSPDGSKLLIARLGAHHSLHILDLATGEISGLFTAPQPQREGVYIHKAAWGTLTVATPSPANPPSSAPASPPGPSPTGSPAGAKVRAIRGAFYPSTHREGDRIVMPITFVDGSSAELLFSEDLRPHELGAYGEIDGGLGGGDQLIDRPMYFRYGDGSLFKHSGPLETYEGHGAPVQVWDPPPGNLRCPNLVFEFGDWFVGVPTTCREKLSKEEKAQWARGLIGRQTRDGFLVLDAIPPLQIAQTGSDGPQLWLQGPDISPSITLTPGRCGSNEPPDEDVRVMSDGQEVSFGRVVRTWYADWCEDGMISIQVESSDRGYVEAAADSLRVQNIWLAEP